MDRTEENILALLNDKPEEAISLMYDKYFQFLAKVAFRILRDEAKTQDIVQNVFIDIWKKREGLEVKSSFRQYLRKAAVNKSLNILRSDKKERDEHYVIEDIQVAELGDQSSILETEELKQKINEAIESLPERCRLIFSLSRFESMTYKEIAEKLEISVKTVENQMTKALKIMRFKIIESNNIDNK